jgi:hypothetical protein
MNIVDRINIAAIFSNGSIQRVVPDTLELGEVLVILTRTIDGHLDIRRSGQRLSPDAARIK